MPPPFLFLTPPHAKRSLRTRVSLRRSQTPPVIPISAEVYPLGSSHCCRQPPYYPRRHRLPSEEAQQSAGGLCGRSFAGAMHVDCKDGQCREDARAAQGKPVRPAGYIGNPSVH